MKKILTITLMLAMMIIITACGQQQDKQGSTESNTAETTVKESEISTTTANESETSAESNKSDKMSINIEALNKIEAKDTFEVKISGVEFVPKYFLNPDLPPMARASVGDDAIKVTIGNNTNQAITSIDTYIIGYSDNGTAKVLPIGTQTTSMSKEELYIQKVNVSAEIQPGEKVEQVFETYIGDVQKVKYIVASYTANGKVVKNPIADEWYNSALN